MNTSAPAPLPSRVSSGILQKHIRPGEPVVALVALGVGTTGDFEFVDKDSKSYILRWETKLGGHVIRIPWHLWMQNKAKIARAIMDNRRPRFPLVPLIEFEPQAEQLETQTEGANSSPDNDHSWLLSNEDPRLLRLVPLLAELSEEESNALRLQCIDFALTQLEKPADQDDNSGAEAGPLMYGEMPLHEAIEGLVREGAVRIKVVAHQLETTEENVKLALADPAAKSEVATGGWVRLKTPAE